MNPNDRLSGDQCRAEAEKLVGPHHRAKATDPVAPPPLQSRGDPNSDTCMMPNWRGRDKEPTARTLGPRPYVGVQPLTIAEHWLSVSYVTIV
jgi:hypothetical protein